MARDYKNRTSLPKSSQSRNRTLAKPKSTKARRKPRTKSKPVRQTDRTIPLWRWLVILGLVSLFSYFLYSLSNKEQTTEKQQSASVVKPLPKKIITPEKITPKPKPSSLLKKQAIAAAPKQDIKYDFYRVLPEKEFVLPDYEIKTRKREERIGKAKKDVEYSVQAGAFRHHKDADSLKAKLLLMGFLPVIEKAPVKSVTWYRVKMGPYKHMTSVDAIMSRLAQNGIDALVIENKK